MDSRLRRFPPDRASAIPRGQGVQTTSCFPHLAHRSAAAHKLHSPPPRGGKNNKLKAPRLHPKRAPKNQSKSGYRKAQNEHLNWLHYGRSWVALLGRSVTADADAASWPPPQPCSTAKSTPTARALSERDGHEAARQDSTAPAVLSFLNIDRDLLRLGKDAPSSHWRVRQGL